MTPLLIEILKNHRHGSVPIRSAGVFGFAKCHWLEALTSRGGWGSSALDVGIVNGGAMLERTGIE